MPGERPAAAGSRGPVAREPVRKNCGYRISDRRRHELNAAGLYVGRDQLQAIIDLAVEEFLDRMRRVPGYTETLTSSERSIQHRAGVPVIPEPGT